MEINSKIISIDVDGTLTEFKELETTHQNIEKINSLDDEYIIVISTGLPIASILNSFIKDINFDYLITDLGSKIFSKKENKIIYDRYIQKEDMTKIFDLINKYNLFFTNINRTFYYWFEDYDDEIHDYLLKEHNTKFEKTNTQKFWDIFEKTGRINICGNKNDIKFVYEELEKNQNIKLMFDKRTESIINISPQNVSKETGFKFLIDKHNIPKKFVFSMGDSELDINSFDLSYKSYAPITSTKLVLEKADFITVRPSASGVSEAIDDIINLWK